MPDYSKYNVPSPDDWHAPLFECSACNQSIVVGEVTVKDLLEEIDKHSNECVPKNWFHYSGYNIDGRESWYGPYSVSETEKARLIEEHKGFSEGCLIKFEPRTW